MPECAVCKFLFHPDWMIVVDTTATGDICKCIFCQTLKDEVTLKDSNGNFKDKVTKEEAKKNYIRYLKELSEDEGISKLLVTQGNKGVK
jgi:hypothetical protein